MRCLVCGHCSCCGIKGRDIGDKHFREWFPKRTKELEEHYKIFPEHKPMNAKKEYENENNI